jgi:hypothetical protein
MTVPSDWTLPFSEKTIHLGLAKLWKKSPMHSRNVSYKNFTSHLTLKIVSGNLLWWCNDLCHYLMTTCPQSCFRYSIYIKGSRDSSVSIMTAWVRFPRVQDFFFSPVSRLTLGPTQLPIQWLLGAPSPRIKRQGPEADYSPPSSAKVKKHGATAPLPHTSSWQWSTGKTCFYI